MDRQNCFSKIFPSLQALQNNKIMNSKSFVYKYSPKKRKSLSPNEESKQRQAGLCPLTNLQTIVLPSNQFNKFINLMQEEKNLKKYHRNPSFFYQSRNIHQSRKNNSLIKNLKILSDVKQMPKRVVTEPDHLQNYSNKRHEQRWNELRTKMEKNQINIRFPQLSLIKKTLMIAESPNSSKNTTKHSNRQRPSFKILKSNAQINQKQIKFEYEKSIVNRIQDISAWGADDQ